jgi:hypothetical protein
MLTANLSLPDGRTTIDVMDSRLDSVDLVQGHAFCPSNPVHHCSAKEADMGIFDKKEKTKPDFSDVQSGSSTSSPRQAPARGTHSYTVREGDTLSAIAKREYGNPNDWRRIFEANRDTIQDPDTIYPGQRLNIPDKNERGGFR